MDDQLHSHSRFSWTNAGHTCAHAYLLPKVIAILDSIRKKKKVHSLFDLGCGNGSVANTLLQRGFTIQGIDASEEGVSQARQAYPHLKIELASAYDDLKSKYGQFPLVISLEVVEHVFLPREYTRRLFDLLEPGGTAILSTPYHGYWKNLVMGLTGTLDKHFDVLHDYGHIKFWSIKTLSQLLVEGGFLPDLKFYFVGRVPLLAKSMIVVARKPDDKS